MRGAARVAAKGAAKGVATTCCLLGLWMGSGAESIAQGSGGAPSVTPAPRRLSDWLLAQPPGPLDYPLGLSWRVPAEVPAQQAMQTSLVQQLSGPAEGKGGTALKAADARAAARLRDWLQSLPVTGRVRVSVVDARWMQANPNRDPVIHPSHTIVLPRRPQTVTVVLDDGHICAVKHVSGLEVLAYLRACVSEAERQIDWAWLAQPDARVQRFGVAAWNQEKQDEPAPGTWIWAPRRSTGWSETFSEKLIAFLATQGPAPDPVPRAATMKLSGWNETGAATRPVRAQERPSEERSSEASIPEARNAAVQDGPRSRGLELSASNWGGVGLMQTPTARMREPGYLTTNVTRTIPYTQGNVFYQPFESLETGFRYSSVSGAAYDPSRTFADQSYKDKSVDFKLRLMKETATLPEFAVGMRDVTGTGLFSSEYLVANKRTGDFDWSLGVAWGYLGGRGDIRNPLGRLRSSFDTRTRNVGQGGNFSFGSFFRGPMALFGGVQYQTPWEDLLLKVEYDGNNYQREPFGRTLKQTTALNVGAVYRYNSWVDINFGVERGNTFMLGLTVHGATDKLAMPKFDDPPRVAVAAGRPARAPDWAATSRDIATQTEWQVSAIEEDGRELRVYVDNIQEIFWRERVERLAAVLHRDAPATVDRFAIVQRRNGVEVAEHVVDRDHWVGKNFRPMLPSEHMEEIFARDVSGRRGERLAFEKPPSKFEHGLNPFYQGGFGGPDGFLLFQLGVEESAKYRFRDDTWIQASAVLGVVDNYDKFVFQAPSNAPRVRTLIRDYVKTSRLKLPNFQATHVGRLSESTFYSAYGGLLESMYAGVGGEWLYRPFASRLAVGVDVNAVKQRGFRQDFSLRDYSVATGHVTTYWETGWNDVLAQISAGRYLAKDVGVTVELSRSFKNGVRVGGWATKTNMPSAVFGEGSFDKGIYLTVPFDVFLTRSSGGTARANWHPLLRDGGAKLNRGASLYAMTDVRSDRSLSWAPARTSIEQVMPADLTDGWQPKSLGPEGFTRVVVRPSASEWRESLRHAERLHDALYTQYFRDIAVELDESLRLTVRVASDRIAPVSLAVGRAVRVALRLSPLETREIRVVFSEREKPVATYEFADLPRLDRFLRGEIGQSELADTVAVRYHELMARETNPYARLDDARPLQDRALADVVLAEGRVVKRVAGDVVGAAEFATEVDWLKLGLWGTGLTLASAALDNRAYRYARDHASSSWLKGGVKLGNALPLLGAGAAGLAAITSSDPILSRTGYSAIEAAGTAFLAATGLKYATGRARPTTGLGNKEFKFGSNATGRDAFPSRHTAVAWAVVTPFAEQYHAPWLYGVAAATNLARVGSREHWVSDTVAGSVLGYAIGQFFHQSSRTAAKGEPRVMLSPTGINLAMEW